MAKRNVMFSRPDEPDFLKRIKAEIGYQEGDTVETKRQRIMDEMEDEDYEEREDEKPQVVVIKSGDLTAEEAEKEKSELEKEEAEKPADLSQRIIFKVKKKEVADETNSKPADSNKKDKSRDKKKEKPNKGVLSFNDEEEEED